jgi:hypothetical protein
MENVNGIILLSGKFPNGKKEHILNEIESFKLFNKGAPILIFIRWLVSFQLILSTLLNQDTNCAI